MARKDGKDRGLFQRDGVWWVLYYDEHGGRHREKVGTSKTAAREVYQKRKAEIRAGKFHPEDVAKRRKLLLKDAIKSYMVESEATKRSWKDDKRYAGVWTAVLGDLPLDAVKPADVEAWRREKAKDGAALATVNRHVAFLKRVFNVAIRDEKCTVNPVARVKMHRENNACIRWLTENEEARLQAAFPPQWWPTVLLALLTGLRASEQFGLRWENIDFANTVLTVPRSKHGEKRHVPMSPGVMDILRAMPSRLKSPWVYPGEGERGHKSFLSFRHCVLGTCGQESGSRGCTLA